MIPTIEEAIDYRLKLSHMRAIYPSFIKNRAEYLVNKIIIDPIIEEMKRENFSEKIWKNTYVKNVIVTQDHIKISIISEYFSETGFDVAIAREVGTRDHWIRPRTKMLLSWISGGIRLFSKGHIVSGIKSLHIIENTIRDNKEELKREFNAEYIKWINRVFS